MLESPLFFARTQDYHYAWQQGQQLAIQFESIRCVHVVGYFVIYISSGQLMIGRAGE